MNHHFGLTKIALLAAASVGLLAAAGSAGAQSQGSGGPNQPVPYADPSQRDNDTDYRTPPPPPPAPPSAPPAISYAPTSDSRFAQPGDQPSYRTPPAPQCRLIEDRAFYPDGTTESRSVQACRGPSGRWHVVD